MVTADLRHVQRGPLRAGVESVAHRRQTRPAVAREIPSAASSRPKYMVQKSDGSPADPNARYLVLRLDTDPFARLAAQTYAEAVFAADPHLAEAVRTACSPKVKAGWRLPKPPRCTCGSKCRPIAMQDIGRWLLEWECLDCCDPAEGPVIAWPFVEGFAEGDDFERIGIDWDVA